MVILHLFVKCFYNVFLSYVINEFDLDQHTTSTNNYYAQVTKTNNQVTSDPFSSVKSQFK